MAAHGSSPAAWTAVALCLVGFTVAGVGLVIGPSWTVFVVGAVIVPVAGIVGKVMSAAGMGESTGH